MVSVLPAGVDSALASADPAHGQLLTQINVCNACHSLEQGVRLVGPSWYNLADTAAKRVAGQSAKVYLYNSITNPNGYVVEGYPAGVMLQIYREKLSDQDFADIITYLLTLRAQ